MQPTEKSTEHQRIVDPTIEEEVLATIREHLEGRNPVNGLTKRPYGGTNATLLAISATEKGFSDRWYTRAQLKAVGAKVKKGQRGTSVFGFDQVEIHGQKIRVPAPYKVWAAEQLDDLPA